MAISELLETHYFREIIPLKHSQVMELSPLALSSLTDVQ